MKLYDTIILTEDDVRKIVKEHNVDAASIIEDAFKKINSESVDTSTKISQIFDQDIQNRINIMSSTIYDENTCGMKWVSVFPPNREKGLPNVAGLIVLSELDHGFVKGLIAARILTLLRTSSVGSVAAKYLSKKDSSIIGFIGAGEEAKSHLKSIIKQREGIKKCFVSSRTSESEITFIEEMQDEFDDIEFVACRGNHELAARDSDIIVTATSCQSPLLKADWIKSGTLYIHVGGYEDEYAVSQKADKIVCDDWESVKHRAQTISRMYQQGLLGDDSIYANLDEIILGHKPGRENDDEIIYFNSVGLAPLDVILGNKIYEIAKENNIGTVIDLGV